MNKTFSKENRALLSELVRTDFKLRYQGSVLGYLWSLLKPLMLFAILYIVFARFLKIGSDVPHFPIYLLFGVVLWNFFSEITGQGLTSLVERGDLIRKIKIPTYIVVLSASISSLINFSLNMIIVVVFMFINKVDLLATSLWLPLIFLEVFLLGIGLSFMLSAAFVKYRDISHVWEVIMQGAFYLTPILYPITLIKNVDYQKIILLNPMAQAIQDARYVLVTHNSVTISSVYNSGYYRLIPLGVVVLIFILGVLYFNKQQKYFAENL